MKKALTIVTLVISLLVTTQAVAQESVLIKPFKDDEIYVSSADELILASGWNACAPGLVFNFISSNNFEWTLNGDVIVPGDESSQYFRPLIQREGAGWCLIGPGTDWRSEWRYSIGSLEPGTHVIEMHQWLDHPIIDGGDYDGDGIIDIWKGEYQVFSITVYVE